MMNLGDPRGLREYHKISTTMAIESASPHRLIQLMMERVLTKIAMARGFMEQEDVARKGELIGDAISIVNGLQVSLNHKADRKMADNFDALYDYMTRRLLEANVRNDPDILLEVAGLMNELKEAWDAIADQVENAAQNSEAS